MKILLVLSTIIYTCNGGIASGYGSNSVQEIEIEPQQLQHLQFVEQVNHNAAGAPVEIINIQSPGNGGGYGGGHSGVQSGWQPLSDIHSHSPEPQIIKIIHEQAVNSQGRHSGHEFGGQSQPQIIQIIEEQSYGNNHGDNGASFQPHQIIQVIEDQSYGGHGGHGGHSSHGGNAFEHNFGGHASPSQAEPQIIFADPPSIPSIPFIPSSGNSAKSSNPLSSLGSIIPQFLRLLFGGGGGNSHQPSPIQLPSLGGHRAINTPNAGKLINAYGHGGTTKITKGGKLLNSFYKSGRVIESGTLKISSVKKGGKW